MNNQPNYTDYHPRWLRPRVSTYWWLGKWAYMKFILRELSSIFVAWFVIYLLILVRALSLNQVAYSGFLKFSAHPVVVTINAVAFVFIMFHAITWFALAPRAIVAHIGKKRVPPIVIAASNYGGWMVVSALLIWLLLRK